MGKRLTLILVCAMIVGMAIPAFAEVQNVKVSGDITVNGVNRGRMDLREDSDQNELDDSISAMLSTMRLRVDADLTENVSTAVRLINERVWSERIESDTAGDASDTEIELDLAYITLRELFYEPLTVILGRQTLRYGNGLIVGDPDTNQFSEYNHNSGTQVDTIIPEDLSSMKAFDAARAILNYDPLVIDLIFAKIDEGTVIGTSSTPENDDIDLYGINLAYDWGTDKNLQQEAYLFVKDVSTNGSVNLTPTTQVTVTNQADQVFTWGTRASIEPVERLYLAGEVAWQFGEKLVVGTPQLERDRDAFATQWIAQYALDLKYSPVLKAVYSFYSGDAADATVTSDYEAWDPMFEDQNTGKIYNALFSATNSNTIDLIAQITPLEDLTASLEYSILWLDEEFKTFTTWTPNDYATYSVVPNEDELGQELDLVLTYDYTEDVQLGFTAGYFIPGDLFREGQRQNAYQAIGSVKVSF